MLFLIVFKSLCSLLIAFFTCQDEQNQENFRVFSSNELNAATHGFHSSYKVGEGGFGSVFKVIYIYVSLSLACILNREFEVVFLLWC